MIDIYLYTHTHNTCVCVRIVIDLILGGNQHSINPNFQLSIYGSRFSDKKKILRKMQISVDYV